jgi:hypothetical protein
LFDGAGSRPHFRMVVADLEQVQWVALLVTFGTRAEGGWNNKHSGGRRGASVSSGLAHRVAGGGTAVLQVNQWPETCMSAYLYSTMYMTR